MRHWRPLPRERLAEIEARQAAGLTPEPTAILQMAAEINHLDEDYHRLWHALQVIAGTAEQMGEWLNHNTTMKVAGMTTLDATKAIVRYVLEMVDEPAR